MYLSMNEYLQNFIEYGNFTVNKVQYVAILLLLELEFRFFTTFLQKLRNFSKRKDKAIIGMVPLVFGLSRPNNF